MSLSGPCTLGTWLRAACALVLAGLTAAACAEKQVGPVDPPAPQRPEEVARRYLEQSSGGSLVPLAKLVERRCYKSAVGRVEATRIFGGRLQLKSVEVKLLSHKDDRAQVSYAVTGNIVQQQQAVSETDIEGHQRQYPPPGNSLEGISKSGKLALIRRDGHWKVSCK